MRPVTLFTGQWADMPFETLCQKAASFGYDGLELACWGDHIEVPKADQQYCDEKLEVLQAHGLELFAISNHLVGQAVCDNIDSRHRDILPDHVWGNGDPAEVRQRAAEEMKQTAAVAKRLSVDVVNGFTGSAIWHMHYSFPPVPPSMIDDGYEAFANQWLPILDEFQSLGIRFALEVHPSEIAFDIVSAQRALDAVDHHPSFGFNFDPSHFCYQNVDDVGFLRTFADRIFHMHVKDVYVSPTPTQAGTFGGHTEFGDHRRAWNFRSPGRGSVDFEEVIRTLNDIGYEGPLSVEWEDAGMDREHGAREAVDFVRALDFPKSDRAFDAAFSE